MNFSLYGGSSLQSPTYHLRTLPLADVRCRDGIDVSISAKDMDVNILYKTWTSYLVHNSG